MSDKGKHLLTEKDFVDVVDEEGNSLGYGVPKHWDDSELAEGAKKKSGRGKAAAPAADPNAEPGGNASRDAWVAYAKTVKDANDEDLVDGDKDLTRDELAAKFGTPPA